ncbi:MAG: hypothetical protein IK115_03020 [Lachnospiraceae bacterium]|nr:hypothetical protein [Lachnospiraceae bacterium]
MKKENFNLIIRQMELCYSLPENLPAAQEALQRLISKLSDVVRKRMRSGTVTLPGGSHNHKRGLSEKNFDEFEELISERRYFTEARVCSWCKENSYLQIYLKYLGALLPEVEEARRALKLKTLSGRTRNFLQRAHISLEEQVQTALEDRFPIDELCRLLKFNRSHSLFNAIAARSEESMKLRRNLLERIPDSYVDLYPDAREIQRHFIIHHGPTNSGKTYGSVQRLMEAKNGIYAGPLRLLAYEIYDRLNKAGVYCSLRTGEEFIDVPASTVTASTVEMVNMTEDYDIVVIDEAQLVCDRFRGGSWTRAILGVKAREIHVCCADEALPVITRMIEDCGDDYELVAHTRNTPLLMDKRSFFFPKSVEPHDALIVFSRRDVHMVAGELSAAGINCSIIYGNLPYDVRHREAEKFTTGETEVLVATDAIGLGLNLPIKRVVFLKTKKFDGQRVRKLEGSEIRQIAGRAGRFGIFDKGFVNCIEDKELINAGLREKPEKLSYATIQFPETIIDIDAPMIDILRRWKDVTVNAGYRKADIEREIALCELLDAFSDDKYFLYKAVTIPFDERNEELLQLWYDMVWAEHDNDTMIPDILRDGLLYEGARLDVLEHNYHVCDLLYNFAVKFDHEEYAEQIMDAKHDISASIIEKLSED